MSVIESVIVSLFSLSLVFLVLAILCAMVMILSLVLGIKPNRKAVTERTGALAEHDKGDWDVGAGHASSGELKLKDVDEKTAAMIMAIVSDESKIPLSELYFKSIAAID